MNAMAINGDADEARGLEVERRCASYPVLCMYMLFLNGLLDSPVYYAGQAEGN